MSFYQNLISNQKTSIPSRDVPDSDTNRTASIYKSKYGEKRFHPSQIKQQQEQFLHSSHLYKKDSTPNNFSNNFHQKQDNIKEIYFKNIENEKVQLVDQCIQQMFQNIYEGCNKINISYGNSTMLIGNTGSGKTTLAAYLSNKDLVCKKDEDGCTYYAYRNQQIEQGKIGHMISTSETTIPNKFGEFWDCPGFQDTNGIDSDISNAFFLKKIADQSQGVKFILVMEGQYLENSGIGDCRGAGVRHLLETLVSLQQNTSLQLKNHLLIVLTKVNQHKEKSFYQKKVERLFQTIYQENNFCESNEITDDFFSSIKQVPLELFPLVDQDEGTSLPSTYKNNILEALSQIKYSNNKINYPLSNGCILRIQEIVRYAQENLKFEFNSILKILVQNIQIQTDSVLQKLRSSIDRIKIDQKDQSLINIKCFEYMKQNIFQQFKLDVTSEKAIQVSETKISFFLKEIIEGLLKFEESTTQKPIKLIDFENDFLTMGTIIKQTIQMREEKEKFNQERIKQAKLAAEKEESYRKQKEEQILKSKQLEEDLKYQKQQREIEQKKARIIQLQMEADKEQLKQYSSSGNGFRHSFDDEEESSSSSEGISLMKLLVLAALSQKVMSSSSRMLAFRRFSTFGGFQLNDDSDDDE